MTDAAEMPDIVPTAGTVRQSGQLLEPGGRFPNFVLRTVRDGFFEFYRQVVKGPTLILVTPEPVTPPTPPTGCNFVLVLSGVQPDPGSEVAVPANAYIVCDPEFVLSLRFAAQLAGASSFAVVTDQNQRIITEQIGADPQQLLAWGNGALGAATVRAEAPAPVLILPRLFEPALCRHLIDVWRADHREGRVSGMVGGKSVSLGGSGLKKRLDHTISWGSAFYWSLTTVIARKLAFELDKAFAFPKFRTGNYYIGCYDAERGDYFKAHRDNNSPNTAARRFAITINLNEDYEGGGLWFPEYSDTVYRTGTGGAIVFSCSLLHEALPVRRGQRFAFLGFLHDPDA